MTERVAVVTGASRGIGAHLADALEAAGYAVERVSSSVAPVTDRAAVEAWVDDIVARRGRIDLLVNNAGVIDDEVPLAESDPEQWWRTVEVNVRGPYLMTRFALPHLVASGGRIVNINSGAAYKNYDIATAYNVSKGALARLTAATGLGEDAVVKAFDLAPGVVRTDMTLSMDAHVDRTEWTEPEVVVELLLALASGRLDAWSGRMVRAGTDTVESLERRAEHGLGELDRTLGLIGWGSDDPLT
ncbi:NAD(P)-dependent dehydrogenase (short-subunit alcohol dehydrogenase family) [Knoellia remsis]|uniref:NAD(P)-dependent dehydrogenase (Short-subunit alcohol dehydrogenase family) n=1 Tax=Knoellia remsis TaxID=407159 RepID=A0A2T0V0W1_9MICO|nr:SDR family oxidoreductase [Knoellia remsis]PRY63796.1 NAD(P)-dependent dehydrogenase (short-subunit alcohol dehydrogenase family) [Knoellia remsis]